jgi:hypothetical protein
MSAALKPVEHLPPPGPAWLARLTQRPPTAPDPIEPTSDAAAEPGATVEPLLLAQRLLADGQAEAAASLLRAVPHQGRTTAERVELSVSAARFDPVFQRDVLEADSARDSADWSRAEYHYWRALRFYPLHAGYMVQYGHVLKEQLKLVDAEVAYRSARALGAPISDVDEHILHVQALVGHDAPLPPPGAAAAHPLDRPPTRDDVEAFFALLLHRASEGLGEVLDLLRSCGTCREVALALVRRDAFRAANRELMILLSEPR